MRLAAFLLTMLAVEPGPAAVRVDETCQQYSETHTLVRNDVLAKLDAADRNLEKAEALLRTAESDLARAQLGIEALEGQKKVLQTHIEALNKIISAQTQAAPTGVGAVVEEVIQYVDAPLAFAAGAGTCVGIAWGLTQVQK